MIKLKSDMLFSSVKKQLLIEKIGFTTLTIVTIATVIPIIAVVIYVVYKGISCN